MRPCIFHVVGPRSPVTPSTHVPVGCELARRERFSFHPSSRCIKASLPRNIWYERARHARYDIVRSDRDCDRSRLCMLLRRERSQAVSLRARLKAVIQVLDGECRTKRYDMISKPSASAAKSPALARRMLISLMPSSAKVTRVRRCARARRRQGTTTAVAVNVFCVQDSRPVKETWSPRKCS